MAHIKTGIYAVHDKVADNILSIQMHKAEAAAVRVFHDAALQQGTLLNQHTADMQLLRLGWLELNNHITPDYSVVLDGERWMQMQEANRDTADSTARDKPALVSQR